MFVDSGVGVRSEIVLPIAPSAVYVLSLSKARLRKLRLRTYEVCWKHIVSDESAEYISSKADVNVLCRRNLKQQCSVI